MRQAVFNCDALDVFHSLWKYQKLRINDWPDLYNVHGVMNSLVINLNYGHSVTTEMLKPDCRNKNSFGTFFSRPTACWIALSRLKTMERVGVVGESGELREKKFTVGKPYFFSFHLHLLLLLLPWQKKKNMNKNFQIPRMKRTFDFI